MHPKVGVKAPSPSPSSRHVGPSKDARDAGEADSGTRVDWQHGQPHPCSLEEGISTPLGQQSLVWSSDWTGHGHLVSNTWMVSKMLAGGLASHLPSLAEEEGSGRILAGGKGIVAPETGLQQRAALPNLRLSCFTQISEMTDSHSFSPCTTRTGSYGEEKDALKSRDGTKQVKMKCGRNQQ